MQQPVQSNKYGPNMCTGLNWVSSLLGQMPQSQASKGKSQVNAKSQAVASPKRLTAVQISDLRWYNRDLYAFTWLIWYGVRSS